MEKGIENPFVLAATTTDGETGTQLGDNDKGYQDPRRRAKHRYGLQVSVDEVAIPICVDRDLYRHESSSIRRCSATA